MFNKDSDRWCKSCHADRSGRMPRKSGSQRAEPDSGGPAFKRPFILPGIVTFSDSISPDSGRFYLC